MEDKKPREPNVDHLMDRLDGICLDLAEIFEQVPMKVRLRMYVRLHEFLIRSQNADLGKSRSELPF